MGVRITREGIAAVRAVDTVRLGWDEIAGFSLRRQGSGPWGDKSILVHRKSCAGFRVPARVGMTLPAFPIVGQGNPVGRWLGPADLIHGGQRIPQDQLLAVLDHELEHRRPMP